MRPESVFDDPESPAARVVRGRASELARRGGFPASDRDELEQRLRVAVLARLDRFDPRRGRLTTFVRRVADGEAAKILRARQAAKRDWRRRETPPVPRVGIGSAWDAVSWEAALTQDAHDRRLGRRTPDEGVVNERRMDVESIVERLPPEDRELCRHLMHGGVSQAAAALGVSRAAIYRRLVRLRPHFGDFREMAEIG